MSACVQVPEPSLSGLSPSAYAALVLVWALWSLYQASRVAPVEVVPSIEALKAAGSVTELPERDVLAHQLGISDVLLHKVR